MAITCHKCGYQTLYEPGKALKSSEIPKEFHERVKWASVQPWARHRWTRQVLLHYCQIGTSAGDRLVVPWWPQSFKVQDNQQVTNLEIQNDEIKNDGQITEIWPVITDNGALHWRRLDQPAEMVRAHRTTRGPCAASIEYDTFERAKNTPCNSHQALVLTVKHPPKFQKFILRTRNDG